MTLGLGKCAATLCLLASCDRSPQDGAVDAFRTPTQDGVIAASLVETQSAIVENTIAVVAGRREGDGLRAYAGIIPDQPTQPPLIGEATFEGPYTIALIDNITVADNAVSGRNSVLNGTIRLTTDLSKMTVFGTDDILTVRARINDNQITGEVEVFDVSGVLEGEIGDNRTFGAFHGSDPTHLYAGGFVANRAP